MPQPTENNKKKRASAYHHGDLRSALIAQAKKIVEREGPDKVSLRSVAKAAGVSQAAPYHHFKDKSALLSAVAADGFRAFTRAMIDRAEAAKEPQERLQLLGVGYVEFAVQHPQLFRLMQGPAFQERSCESDLAEAREQSAAPLVDAVGACIPGANETQVAKACAGAWSMVHGMAVLCNDGRLRTMVDVNDLEAAALTITRQLNVANVLDQDT